MEKGNINTFSSHNSFGSIIDGQGQILNFNSSSVSGKDRTSLKPGDHVWFERLGSIPSLTAINIRKC